MTMLFSILFMGALMLSLYAIATTISAGLPRIMEVIEHRHDHGERVRTIHIGVPRLAVTAPNNVVPLFAHHVGTPRGEDLPLAA
jgi:hypothetical protein